MYLSSTHEKQSTDCISSIMDYSIFLKFNFWHESFWMVPISNFQPIKRLKTIDFMNCSHNEDSKMQWCAVLIRTLEVDSGKHYKSCELIAFQMMWAWKVFAIQTFKFLLQVIASSHLVWLESSFISSHMNSEVIIELTTHILNCLN